METKVTKKSEVKTKPTGASVSKYLNRIDDPVRREDCKTVAALMQSTVGEKPVMWGESIVGFGKINQTYSSGKEVEWMVMGLSSRKDAITLYLTCDLNQMEKLLEKLGKYKRGVGCLYIKKLEDIHLPTLKKLLEQSTKLVK